MDLRIDQWEQTGRAGLARTGTLGKEGGEAFSRELARATDGTGTRKTYRESREELPEVPYASMVKDGVIVYNGVVLAADPENHSLNLGDCSVRGTYLTVPLENGGVLNVNRDNYDDLARCMDMFSAEDKGRILRAMQTDVQIARKRAEVEPGTVSGRLLAAYGIGIRPE